MNSLINFDDKSHRAFAALLNLTQRGISIYIDDTNELHAEKILALFSSNTIDNLSFLADLPHPISALPQAVAVSYTYIKLSRHLLTLPIGTVYFCLSYAYKTLLEQPRSRLKSFFTFKPTSGLLTHLTIYLNDIGKNKTDILLVNPYTKNNAITEKLTLDTISKEDFYTDLLKESVIADVSDPKQVIVHPTQPCRSQ
jgi:hypothetical protein